MKTKVNTRILTNDTFFRKTGGTVNARNAVKAFHTRQKVRLNPPANDKVTLAKTPVLKGVMPRPKVDLTKPRQVPPSNVKDEYAGFQTRNPAIRLLKAISRLIFK